MNEEQVKKETYDILLDFYPIIMTLPEEAGLLILRLEQITFNLITGKGNTEHLKLILKVTFDLGFMEEKLYTFLCKRINTIKTKEIEKDH